MISKSKKDSLNFDASASPTYVVCSSVMLGVAENVGEQWLKQNQTTGLYKVLMLSFFFVAIVFLGSLGECLPFIFACLTLSKSLTPTDTHKKCNDTQEYMSWRRRSVCPDWTSLPIPSKAAVGDELDEEVIWHLLSFWLALCVISGTSFLLCKTRENYAVGLAVRSADTQSSTSWLLSEYLSSAPLRSLASRSIQEQVAGHWLVGLMACCCSEARIDL